MRQVAQQTVAGSACSADYDEQLVVAYETHCGWMAVSDHPESVAGSHLRWFLYFFWETNHRFANSCGRPRSSHSIAFQVLLYLHILLDGLIYILNLFAYILYYSYIYIYIYMSRLSDEQPPLGVNIEGNTPVWGRQLFDTRETMSSLCSMFHLIV